jgi:hypothetical protein
MTYQAASKPNKVLRAVVKASNGPSSQKTGEKCIQYHEEQKTLQTAYHSRTGKGVGIRKDYNNPTSLLVHASF